MKSNVTFPLMLALAMLAWVPAAHAGEVRNGGKLVLTGGVDSIEGAAGGGLATWAVIAGNETNAGWGATAHVTYVPLKDFSLTSYGAAFGWRDRVEVSYAHHSFDTHRVGAALGLGRGYTFAQDVIGLKVRVVGDAIWDQDRLLPQIAVGVQYKLADKGPILRAIGGQQTRGADFFVSATKVVLSQGLVLNATGRLTKANQLGLLGFGGDRQRKYTAQFEGSAAVLLAPSVLVGAEYRTKPDNLGFARENDASDLFAAWAVDRHVTLTAAYVDLGTIATFRRQRGAFLSLQGRF